MRLQIHEAKIEVKPENKMVLITGDGRTFPKDLEEFLSWGIPHDVMAMGRSLNAYPGRVMHWANVDSYEAIWWAEHLPGESVKDYLARMRRKGIRAYRQ